MSKDGNEIKNIAGEHRVEQKFHFRQWVQI